LTVHRYLLTPGRGGGVILANEHRGQRGGTGLIGQMLLDTV
jgi:hypothetical protein